MPFSIPSGYGISRKLWVEMTRTERRLFAYEHFHQWLRELAKTYPLRQIGAAAGLDHSTISRLISDWNRMPGLDTAKSIINAWIP